MTLKKRTDQNRGYQRQYRDRRRKEGYVPINIFIRKALRDEIAEFGIPLEDFVNDAIEARLVPLRSARTKRSAAFADETGGTQ
jgi:hypothetical protein